MEDIVLVLVGKKLSVSKAIDIFFDVPKSNTIRIVLAASKRKFAVFTLLPRRYANGQTYGSKHKLRVRNIMRKQSLDLSWVHRTRTVIPEALCVNLTCFVCVFGKAKKETIGYIWECSSAV